VTSQYVGFTISYPLDAVRLLGIQGARASQHRQEAALMDVRSKAGMESERLMLLLEVGLAEVGYRRDAIKAAELSVLANQKNMKGGVRSETDVLNAIQVRYLAHADYVASVLALAENYLSLLLNANVEPGKALELM
jgi:outer membrane protein TolC